MTTMTYRDSALKNHYIADQYGIITDNQAGVILQEITDLTLIQIAAWTNTIEEVGQMAAHWSGCSKAPSANQAEIGTKGTLLRVEPLKWWLIGMATAINSQQDAALDITTEIDPQQGSTLDLSHSRTRIRVSGKEAIQFLNRHLSLDLREKSFPVGKIGSTAMHHVGVTLWRSKDGYELFIPRGFALSLWEGLTESAMQFGLEIRNSQT